MTFHTFDVTKLASKFSTIIHDTTYCYLLAILNLLRLRWSLGVQVESRLKIHCTIAIANLFLVCAFKVESSAKIQCYAIFWNLIQINMVKLTRLIRTTLLYNLIITGFIFDYMSNKYTSHHKPHTTTSCLYIHWFVLQFNSFIKSNSIIVKNMWLHSVQKHHEPHTTTSIFLVCIIINIILYVTQFSITNTNNWRNGALSITNTNNCRTVGLFSCVRMFHIDSPVHHCYCTRTIQDQIMSREVLNLYK